jgi:hypothetical protein
MTNRATFHPCLAGADSHSDLRISAGAGDARIGRLRNVQAVIMNTGESVKSLSKRLKCRWRLRMAGSYEGMAR